MSQNLGRNSRWSVTSDFSAIVSHAVTAQFSLGSCTVCHKQHIAHKKILTPPPLDTPLTSSPSFKFPFFLLLFNYNLPARDLST